MAQESLYRRRAFFANGDSVVSGFTRSDASRGTGQLSSNGLAGAIVMAASRINPPTVNLMPTVYLQFLCQKASHSHAVDPLERRHARGVMTARQHHLAIAQAEPRIARDKFLRQVWRKREIVARPNNQRRDIAADEAIDVRHGTDHFPVTLQVF